MDVGKRIAQLREARGWTTNRLANMCGLSQSFLRAVELGEKGQPPVIRQIPLPPVREVKKLTGTLHEILEQAGEEVCHAFVSITLTDDVEAFQPKERLEEKYDHILEIRIDNARTRKLLSDTEEQLAEVRPEEAFAMFFSEMNGREMTPEERELMRQVIAQEMEGDE